MQVNGPQPIPVGTAALPQDAALKAVQLAQHPQAGAPLLQRAVKPSPKPQGDNKPRTNSERSKGGDKAGRGGSVNLKI